MSNYTGGVKNRRKRALARLEKNVESANRAINKESQDPRIVEMLKAGLPRMHKEIEILKSRI